MWTLIPNRFAYEATYYTLADLYDENANAWTALSDELTFGDIFSKHAAGVDFSALDNDVLNEFLRDYIWPRFYDASVGMITRQVCEPEPTPEELEEVYAGKAALIYSWLQGSRQRYETLIKVYNDNKDKLMNQIETITTSENTSNSNVSSTQDVTNSAESTNIVDGTTSDNGTVSEKSTTGSNIVEDSTTNSSEMFSDTPQDGATFSDGRTTTARKNSSDTSKTTDSSTSGTADTTTENTGTSKTTSTANSSGTSNVTASSETNDNSNGTTTVKADVGTIMSRIVEIQENIRNLFNDWSDEFKQFVIY